MKNYCILILIALFFGVNTETNAQLLEKLIKKAIKKDVPSDTTGSVEKRKKRTGQLFGELMGEMTEPQNFESTREPKGFYFKGWPFGRGDVFLVTPDRQSVHSGYIFDDGYFVAMFPDEKVKPHMQVTELKGKHCKNAEKPIISDPKAKLAMGALTIVTKGEFKGGLVRASSMTKAKNVFNKADEGQEGNSGDYHYIYVYSTKPTSIQCECQWQRDATEEGFLAVDRLDYDLEKGWNLVKVTLVKAHQVDDKRFFTERKFETVSNEIIETPYYFVDTRN